MVTIVIAAHGHLAPALIDSSAMIMGEQDGVIAVTFDPTEGPDDLLAKYEAAAEGETLILVDFFGAARTTQPPDSRRRARAPTS